MKLNSTTALTFMFLSLMLGAGTVSAFLGFGLGHDALQGVTQPGENPTKKFTSKDKNSGQSKSLTFVDEKTILAQVHAQTQGKSKDNSLLSESETKQEKAEDKDKDKDKDTAAEANKENPTETTDASKDEDSAKFPIEGQDGGVTLEVVKGSQQGGSLVLEVNLKNEGSQDIQFLYSFLDVRDERDRVLSAIIEGLPEDIPANGKVFSGTVKIPANLLDDAQKISLKLTDYPEQTLQLKVADIPVVK